MDEPGRRKIQFINLTPEATVRIYTVGGDLVRRLDHPAPNAEYGLGSVDWDLKNGAGELVVPGIYIFHAESPDHLVDTPAGPITLYVQNAEAGAPSVKPGDQVTLSWSPDATFVVESQEGKD